MKIAVLASGGVDSSVALRLLKDQGHELTAFYIKIWMEDKYSFLGKCPWEEDLGYLEKVCKQAKVPLEIVPLQKEYWARVVAEAIKEVKAGRTPNPDILCNQFIKFGVFYDYIGKDFEKVATGHYAQVEEHHPVPRRARVTPPQRGGENLPPPPSPILIGEDSPSGRGRKFYLKCSPDKIKDQTYFLARLNQEQLARAIFPIGQYTKEEVRKLARKYNLPNKDRKDSQGICFLGKIKYRDFLEAHLGKKEGDLINIKTGDKMGEHEGFWYYTIGQRKDIKLSGGPWYVVKKNIKKNIIYIGRESEVVEKRRDEFTVGDVKWILGRWPGKKNLKVKIRHGKNFYQCWLTFGQKGKIKVKLEQADAGIAAGQYAVFYDDGYCLGGGIIEE
ncbi:tRNA-specific 2-thiouridylase [Candidatus Kuenenbacteria bacterium]|nr:tRNA-specific 2-thiouridylase [Candidatus Kuenenbacteria bacterium]